MKSTYETELAIDADGCAEPRSAVVAYSYRRNHRGGWNEPDYLDSVCISSVRVACMVGNVTVWREYMPFLSDAQIEHLQLRVLENIRAERADYEYDFRQDRGAACGW